MTEICKTVRGLYPHFAEGACQDDIMNAITAHVKTCPDCREELLRSGAAFNRDGEPVAKRGVLCRTLLTLGCIAVMFIAFLLLLEVLMLVLGEMVPLSNSYYFNMQTLEDLTSQGARITMALVIGIGVIAVALIFLRKLLWKIGKRIMPEKTPEFETYTVREGDTLISIAAEQLGDENATPVLKFLNGSIEHAVPGQELRMRQKAL